jgi:hypothetical protein
MAFDVLCYTLMFVVRINFMELNGSIMGGLCMLDTIHFFWHKVKQDSSVF